MTWNNKSISLAILIGVIIFPSAVIAANITETSAAIGEFCIASGDNSTAMGLSSRANGFVSTAMGAGTSAEGYASTAMGCNTTAIGSYSTAIGVGTTAAAINSFAGVRNMKLLPSAIDTFVWGHSDSEQEISTPNAFLIFPSGTPGNVGIGTPSPSKKLDINGELNDLVLTRLNQFGAKNWCGLRLDRYASEKWFIGMGDAGTSDKLLFRRNGANNDLVIDESGRTGMGRIPTNYRLEVAGDALKTVGGNTWKTSSDARLKSITGDYDAGLNEIVELRPVTFYYKDRNSRGIPSKDEYIGFLAQEVQEIFPEAISEGPDGYLDFNMHPVNVALVNAIKELKAKNDALEAKNASLEKEIAKIKKILGI